MIEFHGEEGFAEASATGVPFMPTRPCIREVGGRPAGKALPGARLDVDKRDREGLRIEFTATQRRPGARTAVTAEITERRGKIEIYRATSTWAGAGALRYDRRLRTATVRPPAPFAGHGTYRRTARPINRWTGDLTVDFPGRSDVPLTGPGLRADLEHPSR